MRDLDLQLSEVLADRYEALHAASRTSGPSYLARDKADGGRVVIKLLDPAGLGAESAERLMLEIRRLPTRNHPTLLPPLDAGRIQNLVYYVVPFVEGETLRERIQREGALDLSEAVRITGEIGAGLEASHRAGVVQGQLAPENVILSQHGPLVDGAGVPLAIRRSRIGPTSVESETPTQDVRALAGLFATMLGESANSSPRARAGSSRLSRRVQRLLGAAQSKSRRMTTSMAEFLAALARLDQPPEPAPDVGRRAAAVAIGTGFFALGALVERHFGSADRRQHLAPLDTGALPAADPGQGELNVRQFGAMGNEIADDTDAIQQAIDALPSSRGGTVVFPPGTYRITRPLRPISNCRLVGGGFTDRAVNPVPTSQITGSALTRPLIECGAGLTSIQLVGLGFSGNARSGSKGVHASRVDNLCIFDCFFDHFGDQAIHIEAGLAAYLRNVFVQNSCLVRSCRSSMVGAIELGNDDTYGYGINANASITGRGKYADGKIAAMYLPGAGALLTTCVAGFAEVGFAVGPSGSNIRLLGCRGEFNQGPGFVVEGFGNLFIGNVAFSNSQSADNTYSGFVITGGQNLFSNNRVAGMYQDTARQRDGFEDRYGCCADIKFANHYYGNRLGPDVRGSLYSIDGSSLHGTADLIGPDFHVSRGAIVARRALRALVRPPYSRVVTPDAALGDYFVVEVTDSKPWVLAEPLNPPADGFTQEITCDVVNHTATRIGPVTFAPCYRLDRADWTPPEPGRRRVLVFYFDGRCWVERSRTGEI